MACELTCARTTTLARYIAAILDGRDGKEVSFAGLVTRLDPYECPGLGLRLARLRAQDATSTESLPSDIIDANHLFYAPYTDLTFVDKRTFEFLRQEAQKRRGMTTKALDRIQKAANLDDIREIVSARATAELRPVAAGEIDGARQPGRRPRR